MDGGGGITCSNIGAEFIYGLIERSTWYGFVKQHRQIGHLRYSGRVSTNSSSDRDFSMACINWRLPNIRR